MAGLGLELSSSYSSSGNNSSLTTLCSLPETQGSFHCAFLLSAVFYLTNPWLTLPNTETTAAELQISDDLLQGQSPGWFQYWQAPNLSELMLGVGSAQFYLLWQKLQAFRVPHARHQMHVHQIKAMGWCVLLPIPVLLAAQGSTEAVLVHFA